jgi:hypothetical protein
MYDAERRSSFCGEDPRSQDSWARPCRGDLCAEILQEWKCMPNGISFDELQTGRL